MMVAAICDANGSLKKHVAAKINASQTTCTVYYRPFKVQAIYSDSHSRALASAAEQCTAHAWLAGHWQYSASMRWRPCIGVALIMHCRPVSDPAGTGGGAAPWGL
eukprot:1153639-Pelagomonas_calceolata.AAC.5